MLPNAVFSWAATRSGLGLGDFIASLTPEKEEQLLRKYNEWAAEKGLKTRSMPISAPKPAQVSTPQPAAEEQDELLELMESVADRMDREALEEAEELKQTLEEIDSIDVDEVMPEEIEDEIEEDEAVEAVIDAAAPTMIEAEVAAPVVDAHTGRDASPERVSVTAVSIPIEQRISKIPKDASSALFVELLNAFSDDVETLKVVTEAVIHSHTRRHRGTAPQRAFLAWLEERNSPQPE